MISSCLESKQLNRLMSELQCCQASEIHSSVVEMKFVGSVNVVIEFYLALLRDLRTICFSVVVFTKLGKFFMRIYVPESSLSSTQFEAQ